MARIVRCVDKKTENITLHGKDQAILVTASRSKIEVHTALGTIEYVITKSRDGNAERISIRSHLKLIVGDDVAITHT